jgi:hypothetical protein
MDIKKEFVSSRTTVPEKIVLDGFFFVQQTFAIRVDFVSENRLCSPVTGFMGHYWLGGDRGTGVAVNTPQSLSRLFLQKTNI